MLSMAIFSECMLGEPHTATLNRLTICGGSVTSHALLGLSWRTLVAAPVWLVRGLPARRPWRRRWRVSWWGRGSCARTCRPAWHTVRSRRRHADPRTTGKSISDNRRSVRAGQAALPSAPKGGEAGPRTNNLYLTFIFSQYPHHTKLVLTSFVWTDSERDGCQKTLSRFKVLDVLANLWSV